MMNLFKKINIYSIKTKLSVCFLLLSVLPITSFAFFSYKQYIMSLQNNIALYTNEVIGRLDKNIDTYISDIENILQLRNDYYIQQYLKLNEAGDIAGNRKYTVRIWETFNSFKQMKTDLSDIRLISSTGQTISCYGVYWSDVKLNTSYDNLVEKRHDSVSIQSPEINIYNRNVFTIGKVIDTTTLKGPAVMCIDVDVEFLRKICSDIKLGENGYVFLSDNTGRIIYLPANSNNTGHLNELLKDFRLVGSQSGNFINNIEGVNYNVTYITSKATGWRIVGITPEVEMTKDINRVNQVCLILIITSILVVILLTIYLSNILTNPIRELRSLMKQASENDLSINAVIKSKDEIGQLGQSFNKMINKIRELLNKEVEDQIKIRKMEMKAMQELIKPHFVYNTLDSIIGLLEKNQNDDAMNMIESLGRFFRTSLSHGKEVITIREELDHARCYLLIQQFRFSNKFDYFFEVDESLYKYKTIKLILQPLIENAIYHGVQGVDKKCLIIIKGYISQDQIFIEVIDNGAGIESGELTRINNVLSGREAVADEDIYFGIRNVNERIRLNFGDAYGLWYSSRISVGTKVVLNLPVKE